ncbi:extensin-like [Dendrobium catenatum]|uniref:extensin-like n=1 Tax=Dendrobium catenatum TaxID=906689 RepID=UPI0010A02DBE|nr:extensin-like [Dendrobium catenatum]
MSSGDDPPCRSFASKLSRKKLSVNPNKSRQPDKGEGQRSVPLVIPSPPPPRSQQHSPSEKGQGQSDPPTVVPSPLPGYFPPPSMSAHFPSPDQAHTAPFYPYYPPPSSQAVGPSTSPHPPYPYPYYYPYPMQPEHGGSSRPAEIDTGDYAAIADKRQYIEPEGDKFLAANQWLNRRKLRYRIAD